MNTDGKTPNAQPTRKLAYCRLLLREEHWVPIAIEKKLTAMDRMSPNGPVVTAFFTAVVEGTRFIGWPEKQNNRPFAINEVQQDGTVEFLDEAFMADFLAKDADDEAALNGVVGINQRIVERRSKKLLEIIPEHVQAAAFDRARIQILDKLHGQKPVGVMFSPQ